MEPVDMNILMSEYQDLQDRVKKLEEQNKTIVQAIWKIIDKVEILEKKDVDRQNADTIKGLFKAARFKEDAED